MIPIFPEQPARLGVYTLIRLLGSHEHTDRYLASQEHVERKVIVEVLRPTAEEEEIGNFVGSARARVGSKLPHVAKVLDSGCADSYWYLTQDLPPGTPLSVRTPGEALSVDDICRIVLAAAELYCAAAAADLPVLALDADMIYLTSKGAVHFLSPVTVGGSHRTEQTQQAMRQLGLLLKPFLPVNVPGQTRAATLIEWMAEGYEGRMLDWEGIGSTAQLIRQQLNPSATAAPLKSVVRVHDVNSSMRRENQRRRKYTRNALLGGICLLIVAAMSQLGHLFTFKVAHQLSPVKDGYVLCEGARVMSRPVSINEYAQFLDALKNMSKAERDAINKGIPENARKHEPDDWIGMQQDAINHRNRYGRELTPDAPVVNVSYWDALAYSRYARRRLPDAKLLQPVRATLGASALEEWTATRTNDDPVIGDACIILSANNSGARKNKAPLPQAECDPGARNPNRTFRLHAK